MEEKEIKSSQQANPRRRPRSKLQIFKEAYLPVVIAGVALIFILVCIIGSISLSIKENKAEKEALIAASEAQAKQDALLAEEAKNLIAKADALAAGFDYDGAMAVLDGFSGDRNKFSELSEKYAAYQQAKGQLVLWDDPSKIVNLSVQLLIADPSRAFNHSVYGSSFNRNFITTEEFSKILQQLYENGYILVSLDDILEAGTGESGETIYKTKPLYLPNGKKPVMLTQTNVNYNIYLIDGDGDRLPDENGGGFASKMVLDTDGSITCEMVDANGQLVTGNFDMVPILDDFIAAHPDFSYKGAKALLALTGYNGLFGYRTNQEAQEQFGPDAYQKAVDGANQIATALKNSGYDFACYTYENISYGESSTTEIQADMSKWAAEVVPILGTTDVLVYAQNADITSEDTYSGEKYDVLHAIGFRYFIGFNQEGQPWLTTTDAYVRQGRLLLNGANLAHHGDWFANLFDAGVVLDSNRGEVPQ